ncbi:MAG: glycyl-radical enzyme activating protein [Longicatena sp.]
MKQGCIFNIQRYSIHDGGGIRTLLFFKGCPFTCPWCCNPESLSAKPQLFYKESLCIDCSKKIDKRCSTSPENCPTGAKEMLGTQYSIEALYDIVNRDRVFYESSNGGITLSGGECLMQLDFVLAFLKKCKENNLHTAIETTLALPIENMAELVSLCDVFLVDYKIQDKKLSNQLLHLDISIMRQNVKKVVALGGKVIARIPLIPTYTTTKTNLEQIVKHLHESNIQEVHLLPFHQLGENKYQSINKEYTCSHLKPLKEEEIEQIEHHFTKQGFQCTIHGK